MFFKKQMRTDFDPKTELITTDELAIMLNISKAGVYRLIEKRQIPFYRVMRSIRFDKNDVLDYLHKSRVESVGLK